jgi:mRNA interferase RelE/StbE
MAFAIRLHPDAVKFLKGLDEDSRNRIKSTLRSLEDDPFKNRSKADIKKMKGTKGREDLYRLRIGDYRAVYAVEGDTVWVTEIFLRGKAYK